MSWLDKICYPLEHPKHEQIHGCLITFRDIDSDEIEGKCALGEIGCYLGFTPNELFNMRTSEYIKILRKAKVPKWLLEGANLPRICNADVQVPVEDGGRNLDQLLYQLNDEYFTYEEISDFIRTTFEGAV